MDGRVPSRCAPLDDLLGGGLETGAVTLVYGEASTGKTNLCLQTAVSVVRSGLRVSYVDTEGVSIERLAQIAGEDKDQALKRILFSSPRSLEDQTKLVDRAGREQDVGLVAVDSFNLLYRLEIAEEPREAGHHLLRQLAQLSFTARDLSAPVIVTAQVYASRDEDEVLPFGGKSMEHLVKTILRFEKVGPGRRRAVLLKHRSRAEGQDAEFRITARGLE